MNYSLIRSMDIANGTGIRVSLFVSGCKFHCPSCFNQEQQSFDYGKPYTKETEAAILQLVALPYIKGLSILGGDPLWQTDEDIFQLIDLVKQVHTLHKDVWLWTGFTYEELFNKPLVPASALVSSCDVLVDGRFEIDKKDITLPFRGSSNQRIINIPQSLATNSIVLL